MSILNINTIGIYLILSLIEAIILINIELKNGTFKENYELLNNTLPNLINSNKENIKKLKQDLELIKNRIQKLNDQQTSISKIIYPENQIEKDNSELIQNDIKIKNYNKKIEKVKNINEEQKNKEDKNIENDKILLDLTGDDEESLF